MSAVVTGRIVSDEMTSRDSGSMPHVTPGMERTGKGNVTILG